MCFLGQFYEPGAHFGCATHVLFWFMSRIPVFSFTSKDWEAPKELSNPWLSCAVRLTPCSPKHLLLHTGSISNLSKLHNHSVRPRHSDCLRTWSKCRNATTVSRGTFQEKNHSKHKLTGLLNTVSINNWMPPMSNTAWIELVTHDSGNSSLCGETFFPRK